MRRYGDGQHAFAGGDVYGFEIVYSGNNRSAMCVMSNVGSPQRKPGWRRLTDDLAAMVLERKLSKFILGVQLEIDDNDRVKLGGVTPGGAAANAGLRPGDVLIKVNGKKLGHQPAVSVGAATQTGDPVELEIERDGVRSKVTVKPTPR